MTDDTKLPPLPYPQIPGNDYDPRDMWDYALAAIKADRQQRGEPFAYAHPHAEKGPLFTTAHMESYAAVKVREALEGALKIMEAYDGTACTGMAHHAAERIRALIPKGSS